LKRRQERDEATPTGLATLRSKPRSFIENNTTAKVTEPKSDSVLEIYEQFLSDGFVSLAGVTFAPTPTKILRDTGASQSLILADVMPFSENTSSGFSVLIQGVECKNINVPLHNVHLSTDVVTGSVAFGIRPY